MIVFLIGVLVFIAVLNYRHPEFKKRDEHYWAKKLSTDKPPEILGWGKYLIYANNSRWYLDTWVNWKLYWIPGTESYEIAVAKTSPEYVCTWIGKKWHFKNIQRVIKYHPNLNPQGHWDMIHRQS